MMYFVLMASNGNVRIFTYIIYFMFKRISSKKEKDVWSLELYADTAAIISQMNGIPWYCLHNMVTEKIFQ